MPRSPIPSTSSRPSHGSRLGSFLLALIAASLLGWWLWPCPAGTTTRAMRGVQSPLSSPAVSSLLPTSSAVPVLPRADTKPTPPGEFQLRVLALAADYEAWREADDPVRADAVRLRFEELLNDRTAALLVRTLSSDFLNTFFGDLALRRWAGADRAAAAAWMAEHPVDAPVPAAALAHDWVTSDPAGLHVYLDSLPASPWKHLVAKAAGEEALVADQPGETMNLLNKITGEDPRRDELYEWSVTKWAIADPTAAATWAAQVADTDPARGERLLAAAAVGYANVAPADAARWAMNTLADPEALRATVPTVLRVWAAKEPAAAARWLEELPAGVTKDDALKELLSVWAFRDLAQARAWGDTLADASSRERAGRILAVLEGQINGDGPALFSLTIP